jgi:hypothetical protein
MPTKQVKSLAKKPTQQTLSPREAMKASLASFDAAIQRISHDLLTGADVTVEKAMVAHDALHTYESVCSDLSKIAKQFLIDFIVRKGQGQFVEGTKGTYELMVDGRVQRVESRGVGAHDDKKVTALMHAKALPLELCMDKVISYELNEKKLQLAVDEGKVTQAEADACKKAVTFTVKRSTKLEQE